MGTPSTVVPGGNYGGYQPGTGKAPAPVKKIVRPPATAPVVPAAPTAPAAPDYGAVLPTLPGVVAANNNATLDEQDAATARTAAIRQAALQYGGLPPGFADKYGDVDSATLDASANNPYSSVAQNDRTYHQADYAMKQALAARGALSSGQLPTNLANQSYQHGLDLYNLANNFGSTVNTAIGNYTGVLGANRTNIANALLQAQHDASVNPAYAPPAAVPKTPKTPAKPKKTAPVKPKKPPKSAPKKFVPAPDHHLIGRGL